jgi:hypothetical protein
VCLDEGVYMKKHLLYCIFVLILFIVKPVFCDSKLFIDEQGRFSFGFTGDWRKLDSQGDNIDGRFVIARGGKAVAEVIIAHETTKKKLSLDEYLGNEKKRIEKTAGYTKINEEKDFQIGGFQAAWILINVAQKDVGGRTAVKKISQYFIKKEETFWGITVVASESDADILSEVQRTMVKSFEFSTGGKVSLEPIAKTGTKTVLDPDRRYSLKVPESWRIVDSGGPELMIESEIGKMYVFALQIEGADVKTAVNDFIAKQERMQNCHVLAGKEAPLKVGSIKGHLINYEGEKSGNLYHVQLVLIPIDKLGFFLYFVSSPKKWDENKALITGVQSTFAFIKSKVDSKWKTGLPEFLLPPPVEKVATDAEVKEERGVTDASKVSNELLWEPFSKDNVPK